MDQRSEPRPIEHRISIQRVFDAPRERVWSEWTEPERFADWFGGAECEVPLATVTMDVRPGGALRLTMFAAPNRRRIDWNGEYREVAAPERLVFVITDRERGEALELVTVTLADLGDGRTEMRFEQRGSRSPDEYERATEGWRAFFDRVQERLAGR
jgi:uncharacterized protein YndB with AHSA1/START domain